MDWWGTAASSEACRGERHHRRWGRARLETKVRSTFLPFVVQLLTLPPYRMDLHEDKEKNLVTATFELPGLKKEDIQLEIQNGRLSVSAESKLSKDYEESGYAVRERRYGKFSRTLQLPQGVKVFNSSETIYS